MAENRDLVGEVFEALQRLITSGEIMPGEKVNENQLAQRFAVSRAPIREAVRRLEQYGLIEIIPNRGAVVRKLGITEILNLYDVRAGLAYAAGRLLPVRAAREDLDRLQALILDMEGAARAGDCDAFGDINITFHDLIFKATRNPSLYNLAMQQEVILKSFLMDEVGNGVVLRESNLQHKEIMDAALYNDAEGCARCFSRHVLIGKQRLIDNSRFPG